MSDLPLFETTNDLKLAKLQAENNVLNQLLEEANTNINKIKADAVREAMNHCRQYDGMCYPDDLEEYSNKLERGEV